MDPRFRGGDKRTGASAQLSIGQVMRAGGFDCVIANPPYVQIENIPQLERDYFVRTYGEDGKLGKRYDIYHGKVSA